MRTPSEFSFRYLGRKIGSRNCLRLRLATQEAWVGTNTSVPRNLLILMASRKYSSLLSSVLSSLPATEKSGLQESERSLHENKKHHQPPARIIRSLCSLIGRRSATSFRICGAQRDSPVRYPFALKRTALPSPVSVQGGECL